MGVCDALWTQWGLFFIPLSHESSISTYKEMNSGWMNFGWNCFRLFLTIKMDDIEQVFFHVEKEGNFITLWNEMQGMFLIYLWGLNFWLKDGWIPRYVFNLFMGLNFWLKMDEFQGMFLIYLWGLNFWLKMDESQGMFLIYLWDINLWLKIDEFLENQLLLFIMYCIFVLLKYSYQLWPTCLYLEFSWQHIELD